MKKEIWQGGRGMVCADRRSKSQGWGFLLGSDGVSSGSGVEVVDWREEWGRGLSGFLFFLDLVWFCSDFVLFLIWLEKEPPRSILNWDDLVSKFINQFFPPLKTTNIRNEITRFQQRFDESFYEAWDRINDLLRACPHHGFFELHQLDTFYNALNVNDKDSLNSAAGVVAKVSMSSSTPAISFEVAELKDMVRALLLDKKNQSLAPALTPTPAPVKVVEPNCVTCGGAHSYQNYLVTSENVYRDNIQDNNMQTQTSNTLHNAIMEEGSKDRPPMLAPGNYIQWKSRIKRYIDTKPNHELIHYCLTNPPYELGWKEKFVLDSEGNPTTATEKVFKTYKSVTQEIRDQLNAEAEAVQIILTGIDNDIYSTVDACPNACEMWKAFERLKQAGSKDRPLMLAPGNYIQWKSRIKRYIDTKPNHELIHYCPTNPPYELGWKEKFVLDYEGNPTTATEKVFETYKSVTQEIRDQLNAEAEAVQIILTGIDNDIYSTVDACPNTCEMWKVIKRLKQGESINVQDLETNLFWEFGKFTSLDGESLESYYLRMAKVCDTCEANQELKNVSYHKLYDILKQHQHEDDTDDESDDQELEAHYMYMAKLQQVYPDAVDNRPIFDKEPAQTVQNDDQYDVFAIECSSGLRRFFYYAMFINSFYLCYVLSLYPFTERYAQPYFFSCLIRQGSRCVFLTFPVVFRPFKTLCFLNYALMIRQDYDITSSLQRGALQLFSDFMKSKAELKRRDSIEYATEMELECAKVKAEFYTYKKESQMSCVKNTQTINDLNQTISEMKNKLSAHQDTISILKQQKDAQIKLYKSREEKEIEKVIDLENKVKKAKQANPRLYDIGCYDDNLALMLSPESDEVIRLEKESRSKLSDLIRPFDYAKLNSLYDLFVPQRKKSSEQRFFQKDQDSDPALECQTMALEHDSLSPGRKSQENVSHGDKTVTMSNDLDLLFSLMFDELLNGSSKVVSKSSAVSTADAPNERQQQTTSLNNHITPAPTCQTPNIAPTVISSENIN
nr:hypothetical protein [Tanacetum cinerariifolium]